MKDLKHLLEPLKEAKSLILMQSVIEFLNENDVDYFGWTDLDMIIYYIENNKSEE